MGFVKGRLSNEVIKKGSRQRHIKWWDWRKNKKERKNKQKKWLKPAETKYQSAQKKTWHGFFFFLESMCDLAKNLIKTELRNSSTVIGPLKRRLQCYKQPPWGAILTLSTSSSILLVSGTSGALGTVTIIGVRVLPSVPMDAVLTTWGCVGGPEHKR